MIEFTRIDHIGMRVANKQTSVAFYERLGFKLIADHGFEEGHPIIMDNPNGLRLNLLGPSTKPNDGKNILMDVEKDNKYSGIRHIALYVENFAGAHTYLEEQGIAISGGPVHHGSGYEALFIRDPDGVVIEITTKN